MKRGWRRAWRVLSVAALLAAGAGAVPAPTQAVYNDNPPWQPGFPQGLSGAAIHESSPTLAELDGDGSTLEIVVAGRDRTGSTPNCQGRVYAYRPNGTKYWETQVRAPINSTPAVADIDGDGVPEVVIGLGGVVETPCWHGGVAALNGRTGAVEWIFDTQDWLNHAPDGWKDGVYSSPAVGDLDRDGDLEVVFGAWDQCIYLLDGATGSPLWPELNGIPGQHHCGQRGFYNEDTVWSSPALADLDGNGTLEIIIGADITAGNQNGDPTGGYVYVLRYDGAQLAREWLDQAIYSSPAVGDLDGDSVWEIVIGTGTYLPNKGYYVKVFNYNPSAPLVTDRLVQKYHLATEGRVFTSPALADVSGDGFLDVVVVAHVGDGPEQGGANRGSHVYAWNGTTGARLFKTLICDWLANHFVTHASPIVAEVGRASGDSGLKVLFTHAWEVGLLNSDGSYYTDAGSCSSGETTTLTYWAEYSLFSSAAVGDIDSDGKVEVAIAGGYSESRPGEGRLYVWEPGRAVGALPWPMFRHDAYHTGNACFTSQKPTAPTGYSAMPPANTWSNDNTVQVSWSGATHSSCRIAGYSLLWDGAPTTLPDSTRDTSAASTTSAPLADGRWYLHVRTQDAWGNWSQSALHAGPFQIDTLAPTSEAYAPPYATASTPIPVRWWGRDTLSGVASFDVQVRVDGGVWQNWRTDVTATADAYSGAGNHVYCFRSRAKDLAGNVEVYPTQPDACTTVANHTLAGSVRTNRGQPVLAATIAATPPLSNTAASGPDGAYVAYFSAHRPVRLQAAHPAFGALPPLTLTLSGDLAGLNFVLPPRDDIVVNGHFEQGLVGWAVSGSVLPVAAAHTGQGALDLSGTARVGQTLMLPAGTPSPTLSLVYRVVGSPAGGDRCTLSAGSGSSEVSRTLALDASNWRHQWLDLSALSGQMLTITLECNLATAHVVVDEVTLGAARRGVWQLSLPLALRAN